MRAIITVVGKDKVGIIARISGALASAGVNILDISQTILQEYFTMMMLVDLSGMKGNIAGLRVNLEQCAASMELSVTLQHEEVFKSMHRID
ncbi:MAG: ACT domain-containing protein [Spirochaetales bacterium]|nr:ACT domain-containing protein [Spirochaetales bacterium]